MARQASELRAATPYIGLDELEDALDAVTFAVELEGEMIGDPDTRNHRLSREHFLKVSYSLSVDQEAVRRRVDSAMQNVRLPGDSLSFLCYAISPTLKQSRLLFPGQDDGRVLLQPVASANGLPHRIDFVIAGADHLFRDVSGFDVVYGFVLNRFNDVRDPLTPKYKASWLSRRAQRVRILARRSASYELHPLTDEDRRRFGLSGRPLFYVRQIDDAVSPLFTPNLDDVVEIYVDEDVLPRLQAERPGAATRYIASQIAAQVFVTILQVGLADLEDEASEAGSVFTRALRFLWAGHADAENELRRLVRTDPGRLSAEVQIKMAFVDAAEALLT